MKHISGKEMCKALVRRGWKLDRIESSHHIYTSPDGRISVSVPVHGNKTMPTGTQCGVMRTAGLKDADL